MAVELAGEVGLVVEADLGRDPGDRLPVEQTQPGGLDPPGHQVLVGAMPKVS